MYNLVIALEIIIAIGLMVFVHELGHFVASKLRKIKVEKFSLGFGPRIFGFVVGDTDYRLSALPLGGYVKLAGETVEDKVEGKPWEFLSQPWWARILVFVSGPAMNYIFAFFLLVILMMVGIEIPVQPSQIGLVRADSPAGNAGIRVGDRILLVDGGKISSWEEFNDRMKLDLAAGKASLVLDRAGSTVASELDFRNAKELGMEPKLDPVLTDPMPSSPAYMSGLKRGDRIIAIGGKQVNSWYDISPLIKDKPDQPIEFVILRAGSTLAYKVKPKFSLSEKRALIGISPLMATRRERLDAWTAIKVSAIQTVNLTYVMCYGIKEIIAGEKSVKESVGGPIMVVQLTSQAAKAGLQHLIRLMAIISISLALLNLFPIPMFDGGGVVVCLIEGITRRRMNVKVQNAMLYIGLVIIAGLMLFVTYNDIMRMAGK